MALFLLFFRRLRVRKFIDQFFDQKFFNIDVKAEIADKGKEAQIFLLILGTVSKRLFSALVSSGHIFCKAVDPGRFQLGRFPSFRFPFHVEFEFRFI